MQKPDHPTFLNKNSPVNRVSLQKRQELQASKSKLLEAEQQLTYYESLKKQTEDNLIALNAFNNVKERIYHLHTYVQNDSIHSLQNIIKQDVSDLKQLNDTLVKQRDESVQNNNEVNMEIQHVQDSLCELLDMLREQFVHSRSIDDLTDRFQIKENTLLMNIGCMCDRYQQFGLLHCFQSCIVWEPLANFPHIDTSSSSEESDEDSESDNDDNQILRIDIAQITTMSPCTALGKDDGILIHLDNYELPSLTFHLLGDQRDSLFEQLFSIVNKISY
jgi:hypothetical protein